MLDFLAETFHVDSDRLHGASDRAVVTDVNVRWYKNVPAMARQLIEHSRAGLRPELIVIRRESAYFVKAFIDTTRAKLPGNRWVSSFGCIVSLLAELPS